jgi:hypothetical protein
MKILWNIWGWIFMRWWIRFCWRASWWGWFRRIRHWCWKIPVGTSLRENKLKHLLWNFLSPRELHCPHCAYDCWTDDENLFVSTDGGSYATPDGTCHWFRGIQTCARCGQANEYGDSD